MMPAARPASSSVDMPTLRIDADIELAVEINPGADPAVVFLPGFRSSMNGRKGTYLQALCQREGVRCVRFDYRGHGRSGGRIEEGSVAVWCADARQVVERCAPGPVVLVGASMGGWIMFLLARDLGQRMKGLVGVGAAPDYTDGLEERLSEQQRTELRASGLTYRPSRYGDGPYPLTRRMIDDGQRMRVLNRGLELSCPIHLFHGLDDPDVPWETAVGILRGVSAEEARLTLVRGGDHRLSSEADLQAMGDVVAKMIRAEREGGR